MTADLAEQTAWQRRATAVLADLLERAARDTLPVLWWSVDTAGCGLVGRSITLPSHVRRDDLEAWAGALGIGLSEHQWKSGGSAVTGLGERVETEHGRCRVALAADLYEDESSEGGSG